MSDVQEKDDPEVTETPESASDSDESSGVRPPPDDDSQSALSQARDDDTAGVRPPPEDDQPNPHADAQNDDSAGVRPPDDDQQEPHADTQNDDSDKASDHLYEKDSPTNKKAEASDADETNDTATIAKNIANGHAFTEHKHQFPEVETNQDLERISKDIMDRNEPKELERDRKAFWDDEHQAVVIVDPNNSDSGTIFKPKRGKRYYDGLV